MFVRKKANRSGTISIVVVSKAHGKFTEVKKFGVAKSEEEADEKFREAQLWLLSSTVSCLQIASCLVFSELVKMFVENG